MHSEDEMLLGPDGPYCFDGHNEATCIESSLYDDTLESDQESDGYQSMLLCTEDASDDFEDIIMSTFVDQEDDRITLTSSRRLDSTLVKRRSGVLS
jgi:hypothetical protein